MLFKLGEIRNGFRAYKLNLETLNLHWEQLRKRILSNGNRRAKAEAGKQKAYIEYSKLFNLTKV